MKRVAEVIHIVEAEREEFLRGAVNPDRETQSVLWKCGVRNQCYFALNNLIFMTFEYQGSDFTADMAAMAAFLEAKGHLVGKRRKDVPLKDRENTNWWAPVKKLGELLDEEPAAAREAVKEYDVRIRMDGGMSDHAQRQDISFNEEDWIDDFHF